MRKCKNCRCVITSYKEDEYCPKCSARLKEPYKLFKRRTHRLLFVGLRDAVIIAVLAFLVSLTRFGSLLKWYIYICAGLMLTGSLAGYLIQTIQTNRRMYQNGYGALVEQDDIFARQIAKHRKGK